jgi:hypothetical protein
MSKICMSERICTHKTAGVRACMRLSGYKYSIRDGRPRTLARACTYLFIALFSTVMGACLIKYTPNVLHK